MTDAWLISYHLHQLHLLLSHSWANNWIKSVQMMKKRSTHLILDRVVGALTNKLMFHHSINGFTFSVMSKWWQWWHPLNLYSSIINYYTSKTNRQGWRFLHLCSILNCQFLNLQNCNQSLNPWVPSFHHHKTTLTDI